MRVRSRGHLCPVCIRPVQGGVCGAHGPWRPHQLLTGADRRRSARRRWHPFEPVAQACPRCLGDVAPLHDGFACIDHGHDQDPHGPFRVDQLLGATAQRESSVQRARLARRAERARDPRGPLGLTLPDLGRTTRLVGSAAVIAATLAYLVR